MTGGLRSLGSELDGAAELLLGGGKIFPALGDAAAVGCALARIVRCDGVRHFGSLIQSATHEGGGLQVELEQIPGGVPIMRVETIGLFKIDARFDGQGGCGKGCILRAQTVGTAQQKVAFGALRIGVNGFFKRVGRTVQIVHLQVGLAEKTQRRSVARALQFVGSGGVVGGGVEALGVVKGGCAVCGEPCKQKEKR